MSAAAAADQAPHQAYRARRATLAKKAQGAAVLLFAEHEPKDDHLRFRQDSNFYYLTGWEEPDAVLLLVAARPTRGTVPGRPYTEILFIPETNARREHVSGPMLSASNPAAPSITGVDRVEFVGRLAEEVRGLVGHTRSPIYVLHPNDVANIQLRAALQSLRSANSGGQVRLIDVEPILKVMRMVKDKYELTLLRDAVNASVAAHLEAFNVVRPGRYEYEIAALTQNEFQRRGCERPAYPPIVGSGMNSAYVHPFKNSARMQAGDVVVIDVGGECSMYAADITRTLPVNGKFTARQLELYELVLGAQREVERVFQPGRKLFGGNDSLDAIARDYIDSRGKDLRGQPLGRYYQGGVSVLGHFVGLDVHDLGDYSVPLAQGNVFTIEPGIYLPEEGLGVRIEDMYWVNPAGKLVKLTAALPSSAEDIERLMSSHH
jgi:Xaa-Pro aminopeptidase